MPSLKAERLLKAFPSKIGTHGRIEGGDGRGWKVVKITHTHACEDMYFLAAPINLMVRPFPVIAVLVEPSDQASEGVLPAVHHDPEDNEAVGVMYFWEMPEEDPSADNTKLSLLWLLERFRETFLTSGAACYLPGNRPDDDCVQVTEIIAHFPDDGMPDHSHPGLSRNHSGFVVYWKPAVVSSAHLHLPPEYGGIQVHHLRST